MPVLVWGETASKLYENGLDKVVLFPRIADGSYPIGYAWTGTTAITESPGGAEPTDLYSDNAKYLTMLSAETFAGTIEAYTFPTQWAACDGSAALELGVGLNQQVRQAFGLAYRTKIGSEAGGPDTGYKLHLIYGCLASPSELNRATIGESPEAATMSWEFTTTPVSVTGHAVTSKLTIDSTLVDPADLLIIEELIFGDAAAVVSSLPLPDDILAAISV